MGDTGNFRQFFAHIVTDVWMMKIAAMPIGIIRGKIRLNLDFVNRLSACRLRIFPQKETKFFQGIFDVV
jgi:hypothetical protein